MKVPVIDRNCVTTSLASDASAYKFKSLYCVVNLETDSVSYEVRQYGKQSVFLPSYKEARNQYDRIKIG
jgi:hypothetical protein